MNDRPRQYFPGEDDPHASQQGYNQQPQRGYSSQQQPERYYDFPEDQPYPAGHGNGAGGGGASGGSTNGGGNGLIVTMGIIAALALLGAGAVLFLCRYSSADAERDQPPQGTETVRRTQTETETENET